MAIVRERVEHKIHLEKHNFKLLLQSLACLIFITSCILIALGVINATFVQPVASQGDEVAYSLVTNSTQINCNSRYTGVYLGLPGLFIGPLGLCLIGLFVPKKQAFLLALVHLIVCLGAFIFNTVMTDVKITTCLTAQSWYLKEYYENENTRKARFLAEYSWQNARVKYENPDPIPMATYVIIAANACILVVAVVQIAAYLLSAIILVTGLGYAKYSEQQAARNGQHEMTALEPHHGMHVTKHVTKHEIVATQPLVKSY